MDEDEVLETLEVDLQVLECGEILERHGIQPTPGLVVALWEWKHGEAS